MYRFRTILALLALMALLASGAWSQEARGSIAGKVADPQGAVIPGASVTVTNVDTNSIRRTRTNDTGYFEATLLNPGQYSVAVEAPGFRRAVRSGLDLNVAGRLDLPFQLEVGAVSESVEVTAAAPLLDTTTASGGRVIDTRQILQLPLGDMSPFALSAMTPGMAPTGQSAERRLMDKGGTSSFYTLGGVGQNEYTLDGAPVTGSNRRVGFAPPGEAVDEFKLETMPFDAAYGHTTGATINAITKGGTNVFHGSMHEMHRQQRWNATPHFVRLAWEDAVRNGRKKSSDPKQPAGRTNNFGASIGGPVRIPKVYNGKDKLFFFFNYYGFYESRPETSDSSSFTVPRVSSRQGDFSDLAALDAVKYTIYDPRSARLQAGRVVRTPFPGNKGIPVLNPVYRFYEKIYPLPNDPPGLVSPEGNNNYMVPGAIRQIWGVKSFINRADYNLSDRHRLYGRWYWDHAYEPGGDWTVETSPGLHINGLTRFNKGGGGRYLWALSSATVLDLGVSFTRFNEGYIRPKQLALKPTDVGLPSYLDVKSGDYHTLASLNIGGMQGMGNNYGVITGRGATGEFSAAMTTIRGSHSLKYGWQERRYWFTSAGPGYSSGIFSFDRSYMRPTDDNTTAADLGLSWAAFMMGVPSTISIDTNDSGFWSTPFRALYVQDDWRLSNRLRLSLGLRYEREGGITERFSRAVAGGFLADAKLPFSDAAEAAYARSPLTELPAAQFKVLGGTEYLGAQRKKFTDGTNFLLPRIGVVYQINSKTVLRTGYGWYYDTLNANNTRANQLGYSLPTGTPVSNDNGVTFCCGVGAAAGLSSSSNPMADPFPVRADGSRFDVPYGNSLGPVAFAGRGLTFTPRDFQPARQQRWRIGLQRQIGGDTLLDVSYNGSYAKIPVSQPVSFLPQQYWATGNVRNQAIDDDLNRNVPNPFSTANLSALQTSNPALYGYLRTQAFFTGSTIRKNQLLRAFPQMNGLTGVRPGISAADSMGRTRYHDFQFLFEKRYSRGLQSTVMYTYSYSETQDFYWDEYDARPSYEPNTLTRPHRLVWSTIYELPFGKGRKWVQTGPIQHLIGGWQLSWIYQFQSGPPTSWGRYFYYGDLNNIQDVFNQEKAHSQDVHLWFDPNIAYRGTGPVPSGFSGFEGRAANQPGSFHRRVFPARLGSLRADGVRGWDAKILRRFRFAERASFSVAADIINLTSHTNFGAPVTNPTNRDFGRVTGQQGVGRTIQVAGRLEF
ncbi:MAG: TonB-dependent receptor [Bryobacterales bacterium]|nr:TonB-dependent receptor [Bryobacterales bacterium]